MTAAHWYQQLAQQAREDSLLQTHQAATPEHIQRVLGGLPILHTNDADLRALYDAGLRAVWTSRCDIPDGAVPASYRAIGPQICVNAIFPWDWAVGPETSVGADLAASHDTLLKFCSTHRQNQRQNVWFMGRILAIGIRLIIGL